MPEYFINSREDRTLKAYLVLVSLAQSRQTILFSQLAEILEVADVGLRPYLNPIYNYCVDNGLPAVTSLVVNATTGEPSIDFNENPRPNRGADWEELYLQREASYDFNWAKLKPPTADEFF